LRRYNFKEVLAFWTNSFHLDRFATDRTRTQYTNCRLCSTSWAWASNARNMYRPLILNKLNRKSITLVLLYWYFPVLDQLKPLFPIAGFRIHGNSPWRIVLRQSNSNT
jgi:hypothetical protein